MSNLRSILEKYKKVEGGHLDPQRSGADGAEDDFIGKHIDNVDTYEGPSVDADGRSHTPKNPDKMAPRKKHRKGYEPGEDKSVYEESDLSLDEDMKAFAYLVNEAVSEFYEEEATESEKQWLDEMLSTNEGYEELISALFEEDKDEDECEECGESPCCCDDAKASKTKDTIVNTEPKLNQVKENIERTADVKMVKVKTPDGKVVYRKQRPEIKIGN